MSWTFDDTKIDNLYKVRLLIGDTDTTDQLMQDEHIKVFLDNTSNMNLVAYKCCLAISSSLARKADETFGDIAIKSSQRSARYLEIAAMYQNDANKSMQSFGIKPLGNSSFSIGIMDNRC